MSYVQQMGDVSYLGIGPPGFTFVRLRDAAHIAAEADAELDQLRARLAEAERRATQFSKQQVTLVNQVTALQARLAESEAQRAALVAALEALNA